MTIRFLTNKVTQMGITRTLLMFGKTKPLNRPAIVPAIRNAFHQPPTLITKIKWGNALSFVTSTNEPQDLSYLIQKGTSVTQSLMQSFIEAQQEKNQRADDILGVVVRETTHKIDELISMPSTEQDRITEQLKTVHSDYQKNEKQIKKIQKTASFLQKNTPELIQKMVGSELIEVLSTTIDPHTLSKFCNALRYSTKIASQVVPALRVLNNLALAYDTAKILYPEHVNELERYVVTTLEEHQQALATNIIRQGRSLKDRFNELKKATTPAQENSHTDEVRTEFSPYPIKASHPKL